MCMCGCVWKERERESESEETSRVALAILDAFPLPTFGRDALFASFAKNYRIAFPSHRNGLYFTDDRIPSIPPEARENV